MARTKWSRLAMAWTGLLGMQGPSLAEESPVMGAWLVEKAKPSDDLTAPGTVWILSNSGIAFIQAGKLVRQTTCKSRELAQGSRAFDCGDTTLVVSQPNAGTATLRSDGMEATIRQASAADTARYMKVVASDNAAAKGVCDRAKRCCAEAMPLLGGTCDKDSLPREDVVAECEKSLTGYRALLTGMKKKAPASCAGR